MKSFSKRISSLCFVVFLAVLAGGGPDLSDMAISDCFPFACQPTHAAPSVSTEAATSVTSSSAVLNGYVNPNWKDTGAWFE